VLGGGFVGIKTAIALKRLGLTVTMIEKLDRILYEKLDKRGSAIIQDLLKRFDVEIVTNQSDYEIIRTGGAVRSVRLASGRIIDADLIVVAVGTKPNTEPFRDAGVRVNKGIVVQETLQTSVPDVYAAGDVVECRDTVTGALAVSALWTNAEEMGKLAGKNMAGSDMKYAGFLSLMNTVEVLDVPVTAIGLIDPQNSGYDIFVENAGNAYRKLVFRNDTLVGALFIGSPEMTDVYTHLIKNQIPVGKFKGLDIRGKVGDVSFGSSPGAL
jgi:NAD(P)H-nitrite reductase large subunit